MERRKFIKNSGKALLALSSLSITGSILSACSNNDDSDDFFNDGYYDDGYYDDGYYDDGYYDDGYYDDGYYDDGYYGDANGIRDILLAGLWFVSSYIDSGTDQTNNYNGYNIDFNSGNAVSATNGSNTNDGTWVVNSVGSELDLGFTGSPFNEFDGSWDIISVLTNRIELQDVSGGSGTTDTLILEKV